MPHKTILIVDDDSDDRFFMLHAIKSCEIPAKVIEAENGLDMLRVLNENDGEISLIIIDMNMPLMNGLEAIPHIRAAPATLTVPVIMISTSPSDALIRKALEAGVTSLQPKPNSIEEFIELIRMLQKTFLS